MVWSARTGASGGYSANSGALGNGDAYELRALTSELAQSFGATPAAEGALGRAVEDFARGVALRFNALAGSAPEAMVDGVARALDVASSRGADGIDGVISRIETAARLVEEGNR